MYVTTKKNESCVAEVLICIFYGKWIAYKTKRLIALFHRAQSVLGWVSLAAGGACLLRGRSELVINVLCFYVLSFSLALLIFRLKKTSILSQKIDGWIKDTKEARSSGEEEKKLLDQLIGALNASSFSSVADQEKELMRLTVLALQNPNLRHLAIISAIQETRGIVLI